MTQNGNAKRPDPDQLLQAVRRQEAKAGKGKLKVFLGMAAGVGKTYDMLNAAHELPARNIDVVIGYVETHKRRETEALVAGLEMIPRRIVPYRSVTLEEMDLDAVLTRRPQIALVDEAAHTNAPGSRHTKRWYDILELLDAGIDVYTTLNVQHLESLADTVREITGVTVTETIPDSIIDLADEVILVDLAPEELLKRFKEGKVYGGERAGRAMENFFRPGNLSALRELALRLVADRVNRELSDYRQVHRITDAWKTRHRLMVAVYASPYSETLIRWTRRMASGLDASWYGAHVESDQALSEEESRLLSRNLALVKELGGEVLSTVDDDPVRGLLRLARENQVIQLVVGKSRRGFMYNLLHGGSIVQRLIKESGNIDVYIVSGESPEPSKTPEWPLKTGAEANYPRDFLIACAVPVVLGALGHILSHFIGYHAVGLIFLLGVTILGLFVGRGAVLLGAVLCGLTWNFFFIPPHYTFAISAPEDFIMFGMFLGSAAVIGHLTSQLRLNEKHLRIREKRITAVYRFTREIASAKDISSMVDMAVHHISAVFEADVAVLVKHPAKGLTPHAGNTFGMDVKELSVAEWVSLHNKPAGLYTDTLPSAQAFYLPLAASQGIVGVLGLKPRRKRPATPELKVLTETFAQQLAMGIEHEQFNELARHTMLVQESERLYRSILSSVSHELKTPLAAIEGSASALCDTLVTSDVGTVRDIAGEIQIAAQRLSRLVKNLLDMTRLESGVIPLRREPGDVTDLVGTALGRLDKELAGHPLTMDFAKELPLVNMDFLLLEQAVGNILHNATIYTPPGTPIDITIKKEDGAVVLRIRDQGPGLPAANPEQALEKFWRADPTKPGGTGLGLAIAKGWVETHGGTLQARNHPDGGAEFIISLPVEAKHDA